MNSKMMKTVKVSDLKTAPWNPRKKFDERVVSDIAEDLKAGKPLIQAPSVWTCPEGGYYVVAGNTRMEAVRRAGLEEIEVVVWACSKEEAMAMTFKENEQRSDVYPIQQAQLIGSIFNAGKDVDEIVASTGLRKSSVYDYLAISRRVHPDILDVAAKHPSNFTKSDLMELTDYPMDAQQPLAKEWSDECGEADDDPGDDWRPNIWSLRSRSKSLKGCKFAGPGSKCATCPMNSGNIGQLPGFEEEESGDHTCSNRDCYESMFRDWKKSIEAKKIAKYKEKVQLDYGWNASAKGAVEKKPTKECPCCFFWWDGDKLKMMFGPSQKAKKEAEKAKKEADRKAKAEAKADGEAMDKIMMRIRERFGVSDDDYADNESFRGILCAYFMAIDDAPEGEKHSFFEFIVSNVSCLIRYRYDKEIVRDLIKTLNCESDMPDECKRILGEGVGE